MRNALRAYRLPGSGVPEDSGAGLTKSSVSRRFKRLTQAAFEEWMASDLSSLDLVAIQMDGLHLTRDMVMVGAVGNDAGGNKHVLGVAEGATSSAATVQALLENLVDRGLATDRAYLFILDGVKSLSRAVRNTFGDAAEIQRCQVHKGRNVIERLPKEHHAAAKIALRQAWTLSDPAKAQRLLENQAKKCDDICPGAARSLREGMPEMLTQSHARSLPESAGGPFRGDWSRKMPGTDRERLPPLEGRPCEDRSSVSVPISISIGIFPS